MAKPNSWLTIGETARRSGVATSALRFYESKQLISSQRGLGNQRQYHRSMLRRIALILVAQSLGLTLAEIAQALKALPNGRNPTRKDWEKLSTAWGKQLDQRIENLRAMRQQLTGCIGCGCLSMKRCALYNHNDKAGENGSGPRFLLGDSP